MMASSGFQTSFHSVLQVEIRASKYHSASFICPSTCNFLTSFSVIIVSMCTPKTTNSHPLNLRRSLSFDVIY